MTPFRAADYPYFSAPFLALAHRGGALLPGNEGRENSIYAFQRAIDLGYTHIETDVHATADGVLIAFHDDRLDRVTDKSGVIENLSIAEIQTARIAGIDPIPTMDDLFEEFPTEFFNIDLKASTAIIPLTRCINRHRAQERVCVASFSSAYLQEFRTLMGVQVATSASSWGIAWTAFMPLVPKFRACTGAAFQIPLTHEIAGKQVSVLTDRLLDAAHSKGKQVHVWTINDRETMIHLIERGVDGIVTDRPDVLKQVLIELNLWQ